MMLITLYLVKLFLSVSCIYLFYLLLLRKLTFFKLNRSYFLFFTLLSFFIPLIDISTVIGEREKVVLKIMDAVPVIERMEYLQPAVASSTEENFIRFSSILFFILIAGSVVFLLKVLAQYSSYKKLLQKGKLVCTSGFKIYDVKETAAPFSFGNTIVLNHDLYTDENLKRIIAHERVHVEQKHSIDIIWAEIFVALNWYNPFAWLTRNAIKQNLEYIVDAELIKGGMDVKKYQYLLLHVVGGSVSPIMNHFSFSDLKTRLHMMYKTQSNRSKLITYFFIIPLFIVLLTAFRRSDSIHSIAFPLTSFETGTVDHNKTEVPDENEIPFTAVPAKKPVKTEQTNTPAFIDHTSKKDLTKQTPEADPVSISTSSVTERLLVVFDETTTKEKLAAIVAQVKAFGASLMFEDLVFNDQGILEKVYGVLTFPGHAKLRGTFHHSVNQPSYIRIAKEDGSFSFGLGAYIKNPIVHL